MPLEYLEYAKHVDNDAVSVATQSADALRGNSGAYQRKSALSSETVATQSVLDYSVNPKSEALSKEAPNDPIHQLGFMDAPLGATLATAGGAAYTFVREGRGAAISKLPGFIPFLKTAAAVGLESYGQSNLAMALGANEGTTIGRILEPNMAGAIAKSGALMFGTDVRSKAILFGGAQLLEAETNMTRTERTATVLTGLGVALTIAVMGNRQLATVVALSDLAVGTTAGIAKIGFYGSTR